eukprot:5271698-Lingulodinium_polyedra.AAC.1
MGLLAGSAGWAGASSGHERCADHEASPICIHEHSASFLGSSEVCSSDVARRVPATVGRVLS